MIDQEPSENQRLEDQQSYYDTYWSAAGGWKPKGSLRPDLQRWIGSTVSVGNRVLDVGCGDGVRYAPMLLKAGIDLYGVEISPQAVAMACANGVKAQCAPILRNITRPKFMRPVSLGIEWIGSKFPSLLSEQLIAIAQNPEQ